MRRCVVLVMMTSLWHLGCGQVESEHQAPPDAMVALPDVVVDLFDAEPDADTPSDAGLDMTLDRDSAVLEDAEVVDIDVGQAPDAAEFLVDDPLELSSADLFSCEAGPDRLISPRIWRLTDEQYGRVMDEVISGDYRTALGVSNPFDGLHSGQQFSQPADAFGMDEPTFDLVMQSAESAASYMMVPHRQLRLPACVRAGDAADLPVCWATVVGEIARTAWRRPITERETERYVNVALGLVDSLEAQEIVQTLIEAILLSHNTYFRTEVGEPDPEDPSRRRLTPHELASAVTFGLQDSPPDDLLNDAVDTGRFETVEDLQRELNRLLQQRRSRDGVSRFLNELFGHERAASVFKDPTEFPHLDVWSHVRSAKFTVAHLSALRGDTLGRLLTSNVIIPDIPLSCASCIDAEDLGQPGPPRELDPAMRAGILTHRGWLMAYSRNDENDPVARGKFIRERLLCTEVPEVPVDVVPQLPDPQPDQTMRDRLEQHNDVNCRGCHQLMDPLGLTFEAYDHVGLFQIAADSPIDPSGELFGAGDVDGEVDDAVDLVHRLAESEVVRRCFTRTAFRYWQGRSEQLGDACALTNLHRALEDGGGDIDAFLASLFASDGFRFRRRLPEESP